MYKRIEDTNYYITSRGKVYRKLKYYKKYRFKQLKLKDVLGYKKIGLTYPVGKRDVFVHRLVVEAFIGKIERGLEVNHIDGDKTNNNLENLEIVSGSENALHSRYVLNKNVKKTLMLDMKTLRVLKSFPSMKTAERKTGVRAQSIREVCVGERRSAGGFAWCWAEEFNEEKLKNIRDRIVNQPNYKPVKQIDKNTLEVIAIHSSIRGAAKTTGITTITQVLCGYQKTAGGYLWEYL